MTEYEKDSFASIAAPLILPKRCSPPEWMSLTASPRKRPAGLFCANLKKGSGNWSHARLSLELATPERVRAEIAHMAFDDIGRYLYFFEGDKGFEVHARCSDEIDTRNISEVSVGTGGKVTLKLYSRERALLKLWDILRQDDGEQDDSLLDALRGLRESGTEATGESSVDGQEGGGFDEGFGPAE